MSEIKFACPHCRQHIACDDDYAGMGIDCPACGRSLRVPGAAFAPKPPVRVMASPVAPRPETTPAAAQALREAFGDLGDYSESPSFGIGNKWLLFWGALLAPAVFTMFALKLSISETCVAIILAGCVLAGLLCGSIIARSLQQSSVAQIVIFLFCAPALALVSLGFCVVGCTVGLASTSLH